MMEENIQELKDKINKSFAELVRRLITQEKRIAALEDRLEQHNKRSGHKI